MDQPLPTNFLPPGLDEDARHAWIQARLDEAYEDIANGRVISGDEAIRWLENEIAEAEAAARDAA